VSIPVHKCTCFALAEQTQARSAPSKPQAHTGTKQAPGIQALNRPQAQSGTKQALGMLRHQAGPRHTQAPNRPQAHTGTKQALGTLRYQASPGHTQVPSKPLLSYPPECPSSPPLSVCLEVLQEQRGGVQGPVPPRRPPRPRPWRNTRTRT